MLDHVRTLLLNLSRAEVDYQAPQRMTWEIDPAYTPVDLPIALRKAYDLFFDGASDIDERIERVERLAWFMERPDFQQFTASLDPRSRRIACDWGGRGSIFQFYTRMQTVPHLSLVRMDIPVLLAIFGYDGEERQAHATELRQLKALFLSSKEEVDKLSAAICAYVLRLDAAYTRRMRNG